MILKFFLVIVVSIQATNTVLAACQIELDKSKNEGLYYLRTNLGQVPNQSDDRYGYHLVASWTKIANNEPKAQNPRVYLYDKKTCAILKIIELYPMNTFLQGGSEYYGVSFNKSLGFIYVTSLASGIYPNETKYYNYTEVYSYDELKLLNRIDGETPLARAELIDDGKKIVKTDYSKAQADKPRIVISTADSFQILKQSEPITKRKFEELGIMSQQMLRYFYIDFSRFMPDTELVELGEQWVVQFIGKDNNNEFRGVGFTLEGKPLYGVSYNKGQISKDPIEVYEKKFNIKVEPIAFDTIRLMEEENKPRQEGLKKKSISLEPIPLTKAYTKPPSIEEQIARNQADKIIHEQQQRQHILQKLFFIGLAIFVMIGIVVLSYIILRKKKK